MSAPSLRSNIQKDNLTPTDFVSPHGGLLSPEQLNYFLDKLTKVPTLMADNRIEFMNGPQKEISLLGFNQRILHKVTHSGQTLTSEQQSKPASQTITLMSKEMKAEIPITDDTFEDQIERGTLDTHVLTLGTKQVAIDMEEVGLLGDIHSIDEDLTVFDGLLIQPSSHVIDMTSTPQDINTKSFSAGLHAMPAPYKRDKANMRYYISSNTWESYTDYQSARNTILGDQYLTTDPLKSVPFKGVPFFVCDWMPDDAYLLTHKDNIVWGIQRKVTVEKWRDARGGITYYIITVRFDVKYLDEEGVVLYKGLKPFVSGTE